RRKTTSHYRRTLHGCNGICGPRLFGSSPVWRLAPAHGRVVGRSRRRLVWPPTDGGATMRRVQLTALATLPLALFAGPLAAEAQQAAKVPRIGLLDFSLVWEPFRQALRDLVPGPACVSQERPRRRLAHSGVAGRVAGSGIVDE